MPARKYNKSKRTVAKKYKTTVKRANKSASTLQAAIRRTLFKAAESKQSVFTSGDYTQISHNSFVNIAPNNILATNQGVQDPENSLLLNRIGDKITLMKVQFRMMLELNERYSDVTYRILLVRSPRGDTPTSATLFNGVSGNKMLDTLNYQRYTVIYEKWGKIKAPPLGLGGASQVSGTGSGIYGADPATAENRLSRATQIVKFDVDGSKFSKDKVIQYDADNSSVQKTYDYNLLIYAYSNFSTSSALGYYVLAVNDYYHRLVYKDF